MSAERRLSFETVAWLAALLPFVGANTAYLVSAWQDLVPWCFPYLDGCTSISRAARHGTANVIFRGLLLPYSATLVLFWWLAAQWLRRLAPQRRIVRRMLVACGVIAGLAGALYTAALGVEGEFYSFMRRYGINLSFGFTVLAELLLTYAIAAEERVPRTLRSLMTGLCFAMVLMGIASIPMQYLAGTRSAALNAIEWTYSILMIGFFPLTGAAWRRTAPGPARLTPA